MTFLLGSFAAMASGCASPDVGSPRIPLLTTPMKKGFVYPSDVEFVLSADSRRLLYGDVAKANAYLLLVKMPTIGSSIKPLVISNCTIAAPCATAPPTLAQSGGDGNPVDSGLKTIGHIQARTTFPGDLTTAVTYQSQAYTGGGGPTLPSSPIVGMRNSSTRVNCAGDLGTSLTRNGIGVVGACVAWVTANAASLPKGAALLIGVEAGAAVTIGEFLAVAVLALGPVEAIAMATAAGLVAFELFLYIRCSLEH